MDTRESLREAENLRFRFQMNSRLRLECLAAMSKVFREYNEPIADELLSSVVFALPQELVSSNGRGAAPLSRLAANDQDPQKTGYPPPQPGNPPNPPKPENPPNPPKPENPPNPPKPENPPNPPKPENPPNPPKPGNPPDKPKPGPAYPPPDPTRPALPPEEPDTQPLKVPSVPPEAPDQSAMGYRA